MSERVSDWFAETRKKYWRIRQQWDGGRPFLQRALADWIKKREFYSRFLRQGYGFMFSSRQLKFLLDCVEETASVEGDVLEIGCAYGATTIFLYEYLRDSNITKHYKCIDTFSGFTSADISYETQNRGKKEDYETQFRNNVAWFKENLTSRGIREVEIIQADINELDVSSFESVSFCLLDVDLYRPVASGLEKIYPLLSPGGIIVIDDCWVTTDHFHPGLAEKYDGALYAYRDFIKANNLREEIVEKKLGVIRKV